MSQSSAEQADKSLYHFCLILFISGPTHQLIFSTITPLISALQSFIPTV